jgi:hypothetical protein
MSRSSKDVPLLQEFASWDTGLLGQLVGSNILFCQHKLSGLISRGLFLRKKWSHLIYSCKQVTEQKGLIHIQLCLILLATLPQCYVTFPSLVLHDLPHVQISQVLSFCYAIPTSQLLSQDAGLVCFLLILLAATPCLHNKLLNECHWMSYNK